MIITLNIASKNRAQSLRYSNRAVNYNAITKLAVCDCSVRWSQSSCLQVAITADYPLNLLYHFMCYSDGTATSHFCCNRQPLPREFLWWSDLLICLLQFKEYSFLWVQDSLTRWDKIYIYIYGQAWEMKMKLKNKMEI